MPRMPKGATLPERGDWLVPELGDWALLDRRATGRPVKEGGQADRAAPAPPRERDAA